MLRSKVDKFYEQHDCSRISQGDILRDFIFYIIDEQNNQIELQFPYVVVMSQDCDLEQGVNYHDCELNKDSDGNICFNQYLPNILILPAFEEHNFREGKHLIEFGIKTDRFNSNNWRILKKNEFSRYHFFPKKDDFQIPSFIIDFKIYYTVTLSFIKHFHNDTYLATINELFRENLSHRFANYFSRIGLPNLSYQVDW